MLGLNSKKEGFMMKFIGKKIRAQRALTQKDIYTGLCSRRQYSRIENGYSLPSVYLLYYLAKRFGLSMEDLLEVEDS